MILVFDVFLVSNNCLYYLSSCITTTFNISNQSTIRGIAIICGGGGIAVWAFNPGCRPVRNQISPTIITIPVVIINRMAIVI